MKLLDRTMPTHPRTGLAAVGIVRGKPVWPILGGDGTGDGGDAAAQAAAAKAAADAKAADDKAAADVANYTPPASQADLDRIVQDRLSRHAKQYGMTPEEAKSFKDRVAELEADLGSDIDKAVKKATDEAIAKAHSEATPRVVRAEFKAAAKGTLSDEQTKSLMEFLEEVDLSKYVDEHGDVDEEKIAKRVATFAPAGGNGATPPRPRSLGQGNHPPAGAKPGDQGRAQAEKRFGNRQGANA